METAARRNRVLTKASESYVKHCKRVAREKREEAAQMRDNERKEIMQLEARLLDVRAKIREIRGDHEE